MGKRYTIYTALICFICLAASCMHSVHSCAAGDLRDTKGRQVNIDKTEPVSVETRQFVVLGISNDTGYVEEAYKRLMDTCPGGEIVGVTVRHSTDLSFLSYTDKVRIDARCVK